MAQQQAADIPQFFEVRVHGVSGTPPNSMLGVGRDQIQVVAGDEVTGFFRAKGAKPSGADLGDRLAVEAYSWGSLTSGGGSLLTWIRRALWLLLLPFALANVASWARPGIQSAGRRQWWSAAIIRVVALIFTALLTFTACGVGIDMVAWQCFRGGQSMCPSLPFWLDFLGDQPYADPGRRLAIGSLFPVAVIVLLWLVSRGSIMLHEKVEDRSAPAMTARSEANRHLLQHPQMWHGERRTVRLQRLHLAVGLTVVTAFAAWPMRSSNAWFWVLSVAAAVVAAAAVVIVCFGVWDQIEHPPPDGWKSAAEKIKRWPGRVLAVAVAVEVVELALLAFPTYSGVRQNSTLVEAVDPVTAILLVLAVLTAVLALLHRRAGESSQAWSGGAPAVIVGTATFIAMLFTTGATLVAANFVNGGGGVSDLRVTYVRGSGDITVPEAWVWFAGTLLPFLIVSVGIAAGCYLTLRIGGADAVRELAVADYGDSDPRVSRVIDPRLMAAYSHRIEKLIALLAPWAAIAVLVAVVGALSPIEWHDAMLGWVVDAGMYIAVLTAAGIVLLGARMRTSESTRRGVGILWDLLTFWPRVAHPFGPPCYGERVVPQVWYRLNYALDPAASPQREVVLSGHSQGSTISVAVLLRLDVTSLERVHFISYGSQLRGWFGRIFPGVLGPEVLGVVPTSGPPTYRSPFPDAGSSPDSAAGRPPAGAPVNAAEATDVADVLAPPNTLLRLLSTPSPPEVRWASLFRRTDPLGFRVYDDRGGLPGDPNPVDKRALEIPAVPDGDLLPVVMGHSDYPRSPEYAAVVQAWFDAAAGAAGPPPP